LPDNRHLSAGIGETGAVAKTAYDRQKLPCAVRSLIRPEGERRPHFGAVWKVESEGRDPDDLVRLAVKNDRSAEDASISSKSTLPHALAEDGAAMLARHFLFRQKPATERRLDAERSKEVG
jgi:hypothetical protein